MNKLTIARRMEAEAFRDLQAFRAILHNRGGGVLAFDNNHYRLVLEDLEDRWHDAYDNLSDLERAAVMSF